MTISIPTKFQCEPQKIQIEKKGVVFFLNFSELQLKNFSKLKFELE